MVLLHGGLATAAMSWIGAMPMLAGRYRMVAADSRGHGGTDNPADHLGYDQMRGTRVGPGPWCERTTRHHLEGLHSWGLPSPGEVDLDIVAEAFGDESYSQTRVAHAPSGTSRSGSSSSARSPGSGSPCPRYGESQLASITEPTLDITGDRDETAGLDQALRLYRHIPRAELAVISAADHGAAARPLFWDAPARHRAPLDVDTRHFRLSVLRSG